MTAEEFLKNRKNIHDKTISDCEKTMDFWEIAEIMQEYADHKQLIIADVSNSLPTDDYWETRCKLMEQVEENNPCDPDINQEQIEAWSKYHNFIKERGQRQ